MMGKQNRVGDQRRTDRGDPMWQQGGNPCVGEKPTATAWMNQRNSATKVGFQVV